MLPILSGLFVATLIIANITSVKLIDIWSFTFDGGTIIFPISYILGDVLTEIYGMRKARMVIWTGFVCLFFFSVITWLVGRIPANAEWANQEAYDTILGSTPRIIAGSLIAYLAWELSNSTLLLRIRDYTGKKYLWMRTIGSSLIGNAIDTSVFLLVAFLGVFSSSTLIIMFFSNYIWKMIIEICATPFTYAIIAYLRKKWES